MRIMAALIALAFLTGCGDDDDTAAEPADLGTELGCDSFTEQETEELYVQKLYECERDGETTSVYTFSSSSVRDSWRDIAEEFGTTVEDEGPTWLEVS